jgi:hypothetical protein
MINKFKQLLYLCNYPPCDLGGACIIMKQVFSRYDPDQLSVVCDGDWLASARAKCPQSLIPCRHESVGNRLPIDLRPRRFWIKVRSMLNLRRADEIFAVGKTLIEERGIQAIMLPLYQPEFAIAGYRLHKHFGIPYYVWESDDWDVIYSSTPHVRRAVNKLHPILLRGARVAWMTSHNMIAHHRKQFGVEGEFLFNFVDTDRFSHAEHKARQAGEPLQIVYTGAINEMFAHSLRKICKLINRGLTVGGRSVQMTIYTNCGTNNYEGQHVRSGGFVTHSEIPGILACVDVLLLAVAFAESPSIMKMIKTSLYTKTIEYLASSRPILYFGPRDTAQYNYFAPVMKCVTTNTDQAFIAALEEIGDEKNTLALCQAGREFVRENHSLEALQRHVLDHFRGT